MRHSILNVPIDAIGFDEAIAKICAFTQDGGIHHVVTANPEILDAASRNVGLFEIISSADLITADGNGILLAGKILGTPFPERITGIDLCEKLFEVSASKGLRIYLLGGKAGVANDCADAMRLRYPLTNIVGFWHGYFKNNVDAVLADIKASQPDVLLCALGSPFQEEFISQYQKELGVPVAIGVGGSFDVLSGQVERAPDWVQELKGEWLWRLVQNPSRLPRYVALPRFIWSVWESKKK